MRNFEFKVSPVALLVFALVYFFDDSGMYAALLPAAAVHELGHLLFLLVGGLSPRCLVLGLEGLELDYRGELRGLKGAAAIAAGPLFGIAYGLLVFSEIEYLRLSGGISLALSIFNLIPTLPLDGGRLLCLVLGEQGKFISQGISLAMAIGAVYLWLSYFIGPFSYM